MTTAEIAPSTSTTAFTRFAEHVVARLNGMDVVNGSFVRTVATIGTDGYIAVDVTQTAPGFAGIDGTVRALLHLTMPIDVTPITPPEVELIGETALDTPAVPVESAREAEPAAGFVPAVGAFTEPSGGAV